MAGIPEERLDRLVERWETIQAELTRGPAQSVIAALSKEFSDLSPLIATIKALRKARVEMGDLGTMARDTSAGREMVELAKAEQAELEPQIEELERRLKLQLLPKDSADERSAILEIRAGTGGDEAALFAGDLYRMYARYAELQGWKIDIISLAENDLGGYREVIASINGKGVFARMKYESGVHRVQRVPATEASGRIHTSAATVAVLPEAEEVDLELKPDELRIDRMRAGGAGGQHVNKTESAIRITHVPTGIMVVSAEKSQHQNLRLAMAVMRSRLYDMQRQKLDDERSKARKDQVGSGDRSQRIRTYNFPQGRVSDHRINLTLHKLDQVLAGNGLDELIDALITDQQTSQLAALDDRARA